MEQFFGNSLGYHGEPVDDDAYRLPSQV